LENVSGQKGPLGALQDLLEKAMMLRGEWGP